MLFGTVVRVCSGSTVYIIRIHHVYVSPTPSHRVNGGYYESMRYLQMAKIHAMNLSYERLEMFHDRLETAARDVMARLKYSSVACVNDWSCIWQTLICWR